MILSSGIGRYIQNLVPYLQADFDVTLAIQEKDVLFCKEQFIAKTIVVNSPIFSIRGSFAFLRKTPLCDFFWSPHYNVPLLPIPARKRIVTIHDVCPLAVPHCFSLLKRKAAFFLLRQAVKKSDLILTVSQFSKQEILRHLFAASEKIHVIENGSTKIKQRPGKNCSFSRPFFLYVGNLKPHKNLALLIKAFSRLPLGYDLVIAGRMFPGIVFDNNPRIRVLGEVKEEVLAELYAEAIAVVQPSLYEGFGLVPLEAMEAGCPVIASSIEAFKEVCKEAAYYVDPHSEEAFYQGMKCMLESQELRQDLIQKGLKRKECFSWERGAKQIAHLLQGSLT